MSEEQRDDSLERVVDEDETVICAYDGKQIPERTTYLDCDGEAFCEWQCHDEAHGRCPAARQVMTGPPNPCYGEPFYGSH